jgi:hypothetical protein
MAQTMSCKHLHLLPLLALLNISHALAHDTAAVRKLLNFAQNINRFSYLYAQEKVFVHLDNTCYYIGETMWFQSYVVSAQTLLPANLSKVLYVELLSAKGELMMSKKLKIENGRAPGELTLDEPLKAGFYELRAYTRSMLNFGEGCVFSRVLPVYPRPKNDGDYRHAMPATTRNLGTEDMLRKEHKNLATVNLEFFPEGGALVEGLPCKVAFKATGGDGENVDVAGKVCGADGEVDATFATQHQGMGFFTITPNQGGHTVFATFNGNEYRFALPPCRPSGYAMQLSKGQDSLMVQVAKTQDMPSVPLGLTLAVRGRVYVMEVVDFVNQIVTLRIATNRLPAGLAQLTLFNTEGQVLAERMAFVRHADKEISIAPSRISATFEPYSAVNVELQASDSAPAIFSLSIRDRSTDAPYASSAMAHLLLASDLKGYVDSPAWYFDKEQDSTRQQALDLLMLVQGWRRYDWATMAGVDTTSFAVKHPMEKQIYIEGKTLQPLRDRSMPNLTVSMWMVGNKLSQRGECVADEEGSFTFAPDEFYGTWSLSLRTLKKRKPVHSRILLDRQFSPPPKTYAFREMHPFYTPSTSGEKPAAEPNAEQMARSDSIELLPDEGLIKAQTIDEVTVVERSPEMVGLRYADKVVSVSREVDRLRDVGKYEASLFVDFLVETYGMIFYHEYRPVMYYDNESKGIRSASMPAYVYKGRPVLFVVDNNLALGSDTFCQEAPGGVVPITELLTEEVKSFMVNETFTASRRWAPLCYVNKDDFVTVFVYTKPRSTEGKGIRKTAIVGYSWPGAFYHPDYSSHRLPDRPDIRRTLYWNPAVTTDTAGQATVRFYNNSSCDGVVVEAASVK